MTLPVPKSWIKTLLSVVGMLSMGTVACIESGHFSVWCLATVAWGVFAHFMKPPTAASSSLPTADPAVIQFPPPAPAAADEEPTKRITGKGTP